MIAVEDSSTVDETVQLTVQYCLQNNVRDPVEILRFYQSKIMLGRSLEIQTMDQCDEEDTSIICVDRVSLKETGMSEISQLDINELRTTLEVEFYGEKAKDYGGPRKEFFAIILREIKETYFDNGKKMYMSSDYMTIGVIMALSMLQNGQLPQFLSEDIRQELFMDTDSSCPCIQQLKQGLDKLGIYQLCIKLPTLQHLFIHNPSSALTFPNLKLLLLGSLWNLL
ncbi:uncharacterized protein LOC144359258, partial [Saccoglossus kowalevskii]